MPSISGRDGKGRSSAVKAAVNDAIIIVWLSINVPSTSKIASFTFGSSPLALRHSARDQSRTGPRFRAYEAVVAPSHRQCRRVDAGTRSVAHGDAAGWG